MRYYHRIGRGNLIETLEARRLLSGAFADINISHTPGNQAEGAITVDRADPAKLFAVSNIDVGDGLLVATSSDSGATWNHREIANDQDSLPPACCDPSATFDSFGNLFLAYLDSKDNQIELLLSTDAGSSFQLLEQYHGDVDQPTVAVGPSSIWLDFDRGLGVAVTGAAVNGLGMVGAFQPLQQVRGSSGGDFGDIAVGPTGQVLITYQKDSNPTHSKIFLNIDSAGLGGTFSKPIAVTTTHVGNFDHIPAQSSRGIDAEAGLAIDRSGGRFNGRVYLVYTDQLPASSGNTDILLRYSDSGGATWSSPIRVNDDTGINSQLLPRVAVDNTSEQVAVGWYDARLDLGAGGPEDPNDVANDDVEYFAAVVTPEADGLRVSPNLQISNGASNAADANSSIDLGDYTGLDFYNGIAHPLWFDNSNSTGDNINGALRALNDYTANAPASSFTTGTLFLGGLFEPAGPLASLYTGAGANTSIAHGRSYTITVLYSDPSGINSSTLGNSNLLITGPMGFDVNAQLVRARPRAHGVQSLVTYRVINPPGGFSRQSNGTYSITLEPSQVFDGAGQAAASGVLGDFIVDS